MLRASDSTPRGFAVRHKGSSIECSKSGNYSAVPVKDTSRPLPYPNDLWSQKLVLKVDLHDGKDKQKALRTVSTLTGIDSLAMDMKEKKLTVIGTVDPVNAVSKLRKYWQTDIITVGPAKEPEKKEEAKKEEPKKEEAKKEEPKEEAKPEEAKKEEPKKEEEKKEEPKKEEENKEEEKKKEPAPAPAPTPDPVMELVKSYRAYNPQMTTYYYVQSMEENPNACVIC
ncbi:hypothetical protein SADUNF_Sadunf14G0062500 [Salix dunnii]|uniref:HMA domain-containing protein n=1 Tax=Salix dunnii TaxID=1413687 RepID=A0A835MKE4_9ROSI|nr:hypothetical protein SADUNF_Sadunf14G0062500 [Salix dunnii]